MRRGRRYSQERKLNYKKVIATILSIIVCLMFIYIIKVLVIDNGKERLQAKSYFALYDDEKWGVLASDGTKTIEPSYTEYIVIPNPKKDVFIITYDVDYTSGEYKTKVLNSKNIEIFTDYERVEALSTLDKNSNIVYEQNLLKVKKDEKYGLIDFSGKEVLKCEYDEISVLDKLTGGIVLEKDGNKGLADADGKIVINVEYTDIKPLGTEFKDGFITINNNLKYGIVDYTNKPILENKYQDISNVHGSDMYYVKENNTWKIIKKDGTEVISVLDKEVKQITLEEIVVEKNGLYGTIKTDGTEKVKPEYQDLKIVGVNTYIVKKSDKYGVINETGEVKINFEYTNLSYKDSANFYIGEDTNYKSSIIDSNFNVVLIGYLSEFNLEKGYLKLRMDDEYKYYNFKFEEKSNAEVLSNNSLFLSKKDGKYGYIDSKGEVIVDYIYDDATEQNNFGYAAVNKNGKWGVINSKGDIIKDPEYVLDNNLVIDFIGEWHLGTDLNMNYYMK